MPLTNDNPTPRPPPDLPESGIALDNPSKRWGRSAASMPPPLSLTATSTSSRERRAVIAMWLIAIQDNPFRGPNSVSAAPIAEVVAALGTG